MRTPQRLVLSLLAFLSISLFAATTQAATPVPDGASFADALGAEPSHAAVQAEPSASTIPAWQQSLDDLFGTLNGAVENVVFYPLPFFGQKPDGSGRTVPFAVVWLVLGAIFFTIRMRFINLRGFRHAIDVVRGKYTDPDSQGAGEVSHFQALTTALSATVGLGNIAGVAIAVSIGGPGATFWMIVAGLLGMSSKFVECSLGQMYRQERGDGHVMGGAMYYLSRGMSEMGLGFIGKPLAVLFAILCIGGSIAGGNSFQVNQSLGAVGETIPWLAANGWAYGVIMTVLAGIVIIGGIRRIAQVAEKIVPSMCGLYIVAALFILGKNFGHIPAAFGEIISGAFNADAGYGGFVGVLVVGFQRAAFSNEAGVGSAAIAHSAAKTDYPVREGIVALLEPFIDTVVVCTMTALVIVITGAYDNPEFSHFVTDNQGAALTSAAMGQEISWFPYVLAVAVSLFAFSTMISWSYYGERCWSYLFSEKSATPAWNSPRFRRSIWPPSVPRSDRNSSPPFSECWRAVGTSSVRRS